jgi:hypothetical protein
MPPLADDGYSRTVWKPSRTGTDQTEKTLYCGGPNYASLYHEEQQEAQEREERERREAEERERAERDARASKARGRHRRQYADDEDDDVAAETGVLNVSLAGFAKARNDRYAVKLLHQDDDAWSDDDAWGGGSTGSGVLG